MDNIKLGSVNAFMTNGKERLTISWYRNGEFEECTFYKTFDTTEPWKAKVTEEMTDELFAELFNQFIKGAYLIQR